MTRTSRHGTRGPAGGAHERVDVAALEAALRDAVDGEVRFDAGSRGAYATDGSNYRQVPLGVVVPRSLDAGARAVEVCARFKAPVLSRGGGTSLAGQATNTAVIIDWTKYCHALVSVDPGARTCVVEPGIVLDELNRRLSGHRLQFGPKPSTHSHCALGGMIGNNSCGASAQAYGKTVDNVRRLEILTYDGTRMWVGPTSEAERARIAAEGGRRAEIYLGLERIVAAYLADIRTGYPHIPRRVSGYNLDSLLPEHGFDLAKALVGSEGTLVTVLRAELDLVPVPPHQSLLVLGYDDICAAADDVPELLRHCSPGQLEALDGRMAQLMREEHAEVRDALDLCLACKGCKSDCPTGVDMATYKAEFLAHHYDGRPRPAAHYSMGWLPVWALLSRLAPSLVNSALHAPGLARAGKWLAGVDAARRAPVFAPQSFVQWWRARAVDEPDPADERTVVLWPDTFSTYFHPSVAISAVRVLEDAGFRVAVPTEAVCCGLTWISTGQLDTAKKVLRRTLRVLRPYIEAGTPVIGLEPSCTAVFRADAPELLPDDQDVRRLAGRFRTFAEHLVRHAPEGWQPPALARQALVQTHCHQHAVLKDDADRELMRRAHLDADVLDEGCCGLAGNFGFERGHHELSLAVAEQGVLPAVRAAAPGSLLLADGFSCRTQIEQSDTGRRALHLAEVLALGLDTNLPGEHPERLAGRPPEPSRASRWAITAGAAALTAGAAVLTGRGAARRLRRAQPGTRDT
ncbi:dimethylmenaquinone methyltransferase [Streptomyces sp. NRRL B-1140]|uniref:FAD-binding and (Fe-S)-binding domain-containing protein n=1 Tax=Streptomyces sp. NRRL B-1140 TaxID=1415549 RepID=UPI0006AEA786|nr:FAD-binding oxidoreductase [Streptomyces sp. NRRL B-1140]KOX02302.1 dimethylmenaquinone methyltransferase [Streptomyces sp. NRRL B-1140]